MNETHDTRGGEKDEDLLHDDAGAPYRHLPSGRRRREPSAPLDLHDAGGPRLPDPTRSDIRRGAVPAPAPAPAVPVPPVEVPATEPVAPEEESRASAAAVAGAHAARTEPRVRTFEEVVIPPRDDKLEAALQARRRRRRRRNIVMASVFGVFVVLLTVGALFLNSLFNLEPEDYEGPGEGEVTFAVESGWGANRVASELVRQEIVASEEAFLQALAESDVENKEIHPGEFPLQRRIPAVEAVEALVGSSEAPVHYVAIRQNMRLGAALEAIGEGTGASVQELTELSTQPAAFGLPDSYPNIEGFLHPGEYRFPVGTEPKEVLQQLVDATVATLDGLGVEDPQQRYRALTIASILQGESRPGDYEAVAGAIENRLNPANTETGGFLQVDSAVIYGLDRYSLEFTAEEKADASNPYNTYQHPGLPPTPIGSPGDAAIEAAVNPQENDYYYWVTVNIETGETKFATTYEEHQRNQQEYRDYCSANPEACGR
ncbi:endolytic transglycosylase MltG [Zhihengliuella sp.]|uniref:endolytic transglycosylase MltG n=1 Tax=Zhihengliuella sp. TaxID=1954483 RepID=UPI002810E0E7|nr:endolytic transglycosylase MltG [Zhihengliuella sp.]